MKLLITLAIIMTSAVAWAGPYGSDRAYLNEKPRYNHYTHHRHDHYIHHSYTVRPSYYYSAPVYGYPRPSYYYYGAPEVIVQPQYYYNTKPGLLTKLLDVLL